MIELEPRYESGHKAEHDPKKAEKLRDKNYERLREAAEQAEAQKENLEKIRESIEQAAESKKDHEKKAQKQAEKRPEDAAPIGIGKQLRKNAYKQKLREVQRRESKSDRTLSKVIHQPVVEALSSAGEGTIARPSGLLFGGVFSVISSLVILYICRHYGYEYNFLVGMVCFIGGFFLGLILEGVYRIFKRPQ